MERQRQCVLRRMDFMGCWRLDDAFGEDRARDARVICLVIIFDRGNEPDIGIVEEWLKVRAALIFLLGAGVRVRANAGDRPVDRPVFLGELPIVREQLFLRARIGLIIELGAQDRANRIADWNEGSDYGCVLGKQSGATASGFYANDRREAVDDLVEGTVRDEIAAFLEVRFIGRGADCYVRRDVERVAQLCCALDRLADTFVVRRDCRQSGSECRTQIDA